MHLSILTREDDMKASELIAALQQAISEHGDLEICTMNQDSYEQDNFCSIDEIFHQEEVIDQKYRFGVPEKDFLYI